MVILSARLTQVQARNAADPRVTANAREASAAEAKAKREADAAEAAEAAAAKKARLAKLAEDAIGTGATLMAMTFGLPLDDLGRHTDMVSKVVTGVLPLFFILLLIYVSIVSAIMTARRQSHFQKKIVPRYEAFLRGYDPAIPEVAKA